MGCCSGLGQREDGEFSGFCTEPRKGTCRKFCTESNRGSFLFVFLLLKIERGRECLRKQRRLCLRKAPESLQWNREEAEEEERCVNWEGGASPLIASMVRIYLGCIWPTVGESLQVVDVLSKMNRESQSHPDYQNVMISFYLYGTSSLDLTNCFDSLYN